MPEMRRDPLTKRWVLCGSEYGIRQVRSFYYDEKEDLKLNSHQKLDLCPLCEGNEFMTPPEIFAIREGEKNKPGWKVRVVPHRFPALRIEGDLGLEGIGLYDKMNPIGAHEVVIESPYHSDKIDNDQLSSVFYTIRERIRDLVNDKRFKYIMVYKNKGKTAGTVLSHPHSNIIALPIIPIEMANKFHTALEYFELKERCVYCDLIKLELKLDERIVYSNKEFIAITPYASRFPFEIMILPLKHCWNFMEVSSQDLKFLAEIMNVIKLKLEKALSARNYRWMLYNGPIKFPKKGYWQTIEQDYHWHISFVPVITKEIGFEWGIDFFINPTLPEDAANYLKSINI